MINEAHFHEWAHESPTVRFCTTCGEVQASATCPHTWRFIGDAPAGKTWTHGDCQRALSIMCTLCKISFLRPCGSKRASECSACEATYRRRVQTIARIPVASASRDSVVFLTLTAPGQKSHCIAHTYLDSENRQRPSTLCALEDADQGHMECPCSANRLDNDEARGLWNATIGRRWNLFVTELRRSVEGWGNVEYFRVLEVQKRGMLHIHALLHFPNAVIITPELTTKLTEIAMRFAFGHEMDLRIVGSGELDPTRAARYLAKYVSKGSEHTPIMPPNKPDGAGGDPMDQSEEEIPASAFQRFRMRLWFASRGWGLSMKRLKETQTKWATTAAKLLRLKSKQPTMSNSDELLARSDPP